MSRGASGDDLSDRNAKGLADDLGLSLDGFLEACECRLCPEIVTFCAGVRVVASCHEQHELDSIAFDATMIESIGRSLAAWFNMVPVRKNTKLSARERKEFARAKGRLPNPRGSSPIGSLVSILTLFSSGRGLQ
jgi:hypothetical protein